MNTRRLRSLAFCIARCAAVGTLLAVSAVGAQAQAQGYVGAAAGMGRISVDCAGTESCDKSNAGGKVFGGVLWRSGFGAELLYIDWGRAKAKGTVQEVGLVEGELKSQGVGLAAVYGAPLSDDWHGIMRLGALSNRAKATGILGQFSESVSERHTQAYFGIGVGFRLNRNVSIDVAYDISRLKLLDETANTSLWSIGVTASF